MFGKAELMLGVLCYMKSVKDKLFDFDGVDYRAFQLECVRLYPAMWDVIMRRVSGIVWERTFVSVLALEREVRQQRRDYEM